MKTLYGLTIVLMGASLLSPGLWAQGLQTQSSVGIQPQVVTNSNTTPIVKAPVATSAPATPAANAASQPSTSATTAVTQTRTNTPLDGMRPPTSLPSYCSDPVAAAQILLQWTQDFNAAVAGMLQSQAVTDKCYGSISSWVVKGSASDYYNCTSLGQVPGATGAASYCVTEAQLNAATDKAAACEQKALSSTTSSGVGPKNLKADMRAFSTVCPRPKSSTPQCSHGDKDQKAACVAGLQPAFVAALAAAKASSTDPCVQYKALLDVQANAGLAAKSSNMRGELATADKACHLK